MKKIAFTLILSITSLYSFAQPTNDDCTGAIDLGSLPTPNTCGGPGGDGKGSPVTFIGLTNAGATAPNPYVYMVDCQGGTADMANPAQDVWYSVTATGNSITIDLSNFTGTFTNPSIGLWEGDCSGLIARGCANGGDLPVTFEPVTPGETYYIQISGNDNTSEGTFDLTISNSNDCSQCNLASNITVDPLPTNGTYTAGTQVNVCYTISEYEKVNSNWIHGVTIENLGAGWTGTISNITTPTACDDGYGSWSYYSTSQCGEPPGWYFDVNGSKAGPCDNYGDPGVAEGGQNGCTLTFCFTLTTDPLSSCTPGASLGFTINTTADGESGSWTSAACQNDPPYEFVAALACCEPPTPSGIAPESCTGTGDGGATVTAGSTASPFTYQWYGPGGGIDYTTNTASSSDSQSTLTSGIYTVIVTDNNGCQASTQIEITAGSAPSVTVPGNQEVCANDVVNIADFVVDPVGGTFSWTSNPDIGFGTSGTTQIGSFTATNNTTSVITANVTVTPNASGCAGPSEVFSIVVNPSPLITVPSSYVCDPTTGQTTVVASTFTPSPTPSDLTFSDTGTTIISCQGAAPCDSDNQSGSTSATITGVNPTTLESGQLTSVCFTVRHACYLDLDWLTITVGGVTYTSTAGTPAGATYNADLASILSDIRAVYGGDLTTHCLPQSFLTMIEGLGVASNTTWSLEIHDGANTSNTTAGCSGGGPKVGDINDFTVVIEDTPIYNYSWSGDCVVTSGSTSGTTDVGSVPDLTLEYPTNDTCSMQLTVTDNAGCSGVQTLQLGDICLLYASGIEFKGFNQDKANVLRWLVGDVSAIKRFILERKNENQSWVDLDRVNSTNSNNYVYTDRSYSSGTNYYRLKIIYNNDSEDYSKIVAINNKQSVKVIKQVFNIYGQEVDVNAKGLKIIYYEDGTIDKVYQ